MSTTHHLKTWPAYFYAVERGDKTFEVRKNDRCFQAGDSLLLECYDPEKLDHNHGRRIERRVTFVLPGGQFGIELGYVVMGFKEWSEEDA